MKIHLYTICWNERRMLPYFLRHYERFCDAIIVYDNGSDDGSTELISSHPLCELRHVESNGELHEENLLRVKGQEWKQSRGVADWVICCDVDEFLFHPTLPQFLEECREAGITLPVPFGFQMISDRFPEQDGQIYNEIRSGYRDDRYGKLAVFNPTALHEINYGAGCHGAGPIGDVRERRDPAFKLLHFKFLGLEYLRVRYAELERRRGQYNRERGFGKEYSWDAETLRAEFEKYQSWANPLDFGQDPV